MTRIMIFVSTIVLCGLVSQVARAQVPAVEPLPGGPVEVVDAAPFAMGHSTPSVPLMTPFAERPGCSPSCKKHHCCRNRWYRSTFKERLQCKYWGYPDYFCERPFGSLARAHWGTQVGNGIAAQMVLYQYDFYAEDSSSPASLNSRGQRELRRIAGLMTVSPATVMVERSGSGEIDGARRATVVESLLQYGVPISEDQILIVPKNMDGISAEEAAAIYANFSQQAQSGGATSGGRASAQPTIVPFALPSGGGSEPR